jgi:hypothetical protein
MWASALVQPPGHPQSDGSCGRRGGLSEILALAGDLRDEDFDVSTGRRFASGARDPATRASGFAPERWLEDQPPRRCIGGGGGGGGGATSGAGAGRWQQHAASCVAAASIRPARPNEAPRRACLGSEEPWNDLGMRPRTRIENVLEDGSSSQAHWSQVQPIRGETALCWPGSAAGGTRCRRLAPGMPGCVAGARPFPRTKRPVQPPPGASCPEAAQEGCGVPSSSGEWSQQGPCASLRAGPPGRRRCDRTRSRACARRRRRSKAPIFSRAQVRHQPQPTLRQGVAGSRPNVHRSPAARSVAKSRSVPTKAPASSRTRA